MMKNNLRTNAFKAVDWFRGLLVVCMAAFALTSCDDEKRIDFGDLPGTAQTFISTYFGDIEVISIIREKDDGTKNYDVRLSDGTEIEFDANGDWTSVECFFSELPAGILPAAVTDKVQELHPDGYVNGVDKELGGYVVEVTAADGINWNMRFNAQYEYVSQSQDWDD